MTEPTLPHPTSTATRDRIFWSLLVLVVVADVITKRWAERALGLHIPQDVFAPWLRWTLTYNTGAAMNLSLGGASRIVFSLIALGMIAYLFQLYRQTSPASPACSIARNASQPAPHESNTQPSFSLTAGARRTASVASVITPSPP